MCMVVCTHASASASRVLSGPVTCDTIQVAADSLTCTSTGCILSGGATLACSDLSLRADEIQLDLGRNQQFAGARASGNAVLVSGSSVLTCQTLTLTQDQLIGQVQNAVLELRDESAGDNRHARFRGDFERLGSTRLKIQNADFTLCNCGADAPPSWLIAAAEVDVELDERATLWWPTFSFHPPGLGSWTLPLPTPALSIPIRRRAAGFLTPMVQVLAFPYPTVDLPFFLPLGDSYDLTFSPGLRTDWNALRAGARFRYHPTARLRGSISTMWTHDPRAETEPALSDRVALKAAHYQKSGRLIWQTELSWVSDDLYQRDFSISLQDQVARYLPSRTRLSWQHPSALAELEADWLTHLSNGSSADPATYSNTAEAE